MINFYIGKDNIPSSKQFIFDPQPLMYTMNIEGTDFQRKVLEGIEHGKYHNEIMFEDREGALLRYDCASTGTKILFALERYPDIILNCKELGENAISYISYLDECNVFFDSRSLGIPWKRDIKVCVNGVAWDRIALFNETV